MCTGTGTATTIPEGISAVGALQRLPAEILLEIFETACMARREPPNRWLATNALPWILGRVCRRWRDVSWSLSAFSRIEVDSRYDGFSELSHHAQTLSILSANLERSGSRPLSISVIVGRDTAVDPESVVGGLMNRLSHESSRWRSLSLRANQELWSILAINIASLPLLESLTLSSSPATHLILDTPQYAPRLCTVDFAGLHVIPQRLELPWCQVTHYTAPAHNHWEHLNILRQMPNLLTCSISHGYLDYQEPEMEVPSTPIILSHLRKLHIQCGKPFTGVEVILKHLVLPSLEDVVLGLQHGLPLGPLHRLLLSSSCSLKSLKLEGKVTGSREVIEIIKLCPALRDLSLDFQEASEFMGHPVAFLSLTHTHPTILPLLVSLTLVLSQSVDHFYLLILRMVQARWHPPTHVAKISRIQIALWAAATSMIMESDVVRRLQDFRQDGLDINIWVGSSQIIG